jgi:hypothetical protein
LIELNQDENEVDNYYNNEDDDLIEINQYDKQAEKELLNAFGKDILSPLFLFTLIFSQYISLKIRMAKLNLFFCY